MPPNPLNILREGKGAKAVMSLADEVRAEMEAEKAATRALGLGVAGEDFADPMNPSNIMRMSEALGNAGAEGKTLKVTQADRSRVFGPNKGGTGFSGLQLTSVPHMQARSTWGVGKQSHQTRLANATGPDTIWSTFIGSPTQHMSNPVTVQRMYEEFNKANPSPELIEKMNVALNNATHPKTGNLIFPDGIDISNPSELTKASTFDQRKLVAKAMTIGGEKMGEPATKAAFKVIGEETDPLLVDSPTYAVGNRLFTIDKNSGIYRPDLNSAFPYITTGDDMGLLYKPAPVELALPTFTKRFENRVDKNGKLTPLGHKDLTATTPSEFVDEAYLTNLQKHGEAKGGLIQMAGGGAMRGMKKLKGIFNEVEAGMGKGAEFEHTASPLNIMREGTGQWTAGNLDSQLVDMNNQALSPLYQEMLEKSIKDDRPKAAAGDEAAQARITTFERVLAEGLAKRQWVNSNLKNYVKKQMGSPNDPVRALAEQGVTHLKGMGNVANELGNQVKRRRIKAGLPEEGLAQSEQAKTWETLSDNALRSELPKDLSYGAWAKNEWMKDLPEGERVMLYNHEPDLGFQDLLGNIEQRLDAGQLRPDQVNKVTVADTVKSVHDERVRKEENSLRAMQNNAATKLHKEYPNGYKWMEISANKDTPLPEGYSQLPNGTYVDPQGRSSIHNPNYIAMQEALEHEGDIMGHCVGDYCDQVYNKGTKILSLRDPKGESHATLQVLPEELNPTDWYNLLPAAEKQAVDASGYTGYNIRHSPQFKEAQANVPPRISQIKGKQDAPLVEKYRPMVGDLVNTGDYSHVDELHMAGLKAKANVLTPNEEQWLKANGYDVPKYISEKDLSVMNRALNDNEVPRFAPPSEGMSKGGVAKAVMSLADQVRAEMAAEKAAKLAAPPASVKLASATPDINTLNKTKPVYGAREILPREQAEANKAQFLEPSVVKDRMYHGTRRNFTRFSPSTADSIFVTPDPTFASGFAHGTLEFKDPMEDVAYGRFSRPEAKFKDPQYQVDNANVLPVRVQVKNPFDYENEEHIEALRNWLKQNSGLDKKHIDTELDIMTNPETSANWSNMEHPVFQKGIKALGHDAYYTKELDTKNLGIYNPNMVKSDIGNIGTYSTKTPEITEKRGGLV